MKTCCVVGNTNKPEAETAYWDAVKYLKAHGVRVYLKPPRKPKLDFAVAIGGDGTILGLAAELDRIGSKAPILGINFGKRGALCQVQPGDMFDALDRAIEGRYSIKERLRICVEVIRRGQIVFRASALNDLAFVRTLGGVAPVDVIDIGQNLDLPAGDGVVISTPTGSTAYTRSVGGRRIYRDSQLVVTAISRFDAANRSVVVSTDHLLRVIMPREKKNIMALEVDGPRVFLLQENDIIFVSAAPQSSYFMRLDAKSGRRRPR